MLLIYISAGMVMVTETYADPSQIETWNFPHSLYFVVVTLSTVGYGDTVPESGVGKIFVIGIVLVTLVVVPR